MAEAVTRAEEPLYLRNFTFASVRLRDLKIDTRYHPESRYNQRQVDLMAATFDEQGVGVLEVSERADGTLILIDGNHRRGAALQVGIEYLPAKVFHGLTLEQEAYIFWLKSNARAMTARVKWENRRAWGDPVVQGVEEILTRHGLRVVLRGQAVPPGTSAVVTLEAIFRADPVVLDDTLTYIWPTWRDSKRVLEREPLKAVSSFLYCYRRTIPTLNESRLRDTLALTNPEQLISAARDGALRPKSGGNRPGALFHGTIGGWGVERNALLHLYNRGLRRNVLPELSLSDLRRLALGQHPRLQAEELA